jgi:hypothetical protein
MLLAAMLLISGCSGEKNPYEVNDQEHFNVSVKFDANGGLFTTNTSVIVDSYNISDMKAGADGRVNIPLLSPDDAQRGKDGFKAYKNGYFLAGWYAQRVATTDEQGNTVYNYAKKWDFSSDTVKVHASGTYTSSKPVMTLYAAWVPLFEIEVYDLNTGDFLDSITLNPTENMEIKLPAWNEESGCIEMNDLPERDGYTFADAYYDADGMVPISGETLKHSGRMDYDFGVAVGSKMKIYVDWLEGEWFHIYTAEQFVKNAKLNANYVIHNDLDFDGLIWPTVFVQGNFGGTIQGNGYTFKNISAVQTSNSKTNAGLFGMLKDTAKIDDLTFDNVTFTIQKGSRVSGACFGLLAGQVDSNAMLTNVQILNSTLQIDSGCAFLSDDYSIGLVAGSGEVPGVDASGISCAVVGDDPETLTVTVEGNTVTLHFLSE